jgi:predicted dehydrogenase
MQQYRAGIIGCGRVAGLLQDDALRKYPCTHIAAYREHPQVRVVACCSRTDEEAQNFARKFLIPHVYTDYNEMLEKEKLDIVSIAAYAPTRCAMVLAASRNGVRGVFCEKAMATSLREADLMIRACEASGTVLMVNHTRRWDHQYICAKEMIERGSLGRVQSISGTFSGNLLHTGVHLFDAMIFLCGPVARLSGRIIKHDEKYDESSGYKFSEKAHEERVDDEDGVATLYFENGVIGNVLGLAKKYFIFELDIQGTEGRLKIGNGLFEYWTMRPSLQYTDFRELQLETKIAPGRRPPGMVAAVFDLIHAIETGNATCCDGRDARHALECALGIYESHASRGACIDLPLANIDLRITSR